MNQYVIQVMKARLKNILHLLAAMLLVAELSSCTEEPLFEERARVTEGLPARVMLDFRSEKSRVETRAAQDATYEDRVNNLYVFIFNPAGRCITANSLPMASAIAETIAKVPL